MKTHPLSGQTLADLAVVHAGSLEAWLALASANGLSVTDDIRPETEIELSPVLRKDVVNQFALSGRQPATALHVESGVPLRGGVGYMAVGVDFIVS